jgi:hypothetical protein
MHVPMIRWGQVGRMSVALAVAMTARAGAQRSDSATVANYGSQHAAAERQLAQDEQRLAELRRQRLALESKLDSMTAGATAAHANTLLMSSDITALKSLDSLLTAAEHALVADRDRFLALSNSVHSRVTGTLVIVIRGDSGQTAAGPGFDSLRVTVDSVPVATRGYSTLANSAIGAGAANEVYRSSALPGGHAIGLAVTFQSESGARPAAGGTSFMADVRAGLVTYVQFAWHGGQWATTTWAAAASTAGH